MNLNTSTDAIEDYFEQNSTNGFTERVKISDIRFNPKNFYRDHTDEEYEEFRNAAPAYAKKNWQKQALDVYPDSLGDGKHYTLLNGEKRLWIANYNYQNGYIPSEYVEVIVHAKPQTEEEELGLLIQFNNHEQYSSEKKKEIVHKLYQMFKKEHPELSNNKLSLLMCGSIGLSDRRIRDYIREFENDTHSKLQQNIDDNEQHEIAEQTKEKQILEEQLEKVSAAISGQTASKAKIKQTKKKGYVLTFNLENIDDLQGFLSLMNLEDIDLEGLD